MPEPGISSWRDGTFLFTIPLHKTDPLGKFTVRALSCSCNIRTHNLCVWHSAERHLVRLEAHPARGSGQQFPLFPDEAGRTASKQKFIEAIRTVIARTDTPMTRQGSGRTGDPTFSWALPQDFGGPDVVQFWSGAGFDPTFGTLDQHGSPAVHSGQCASESPQHTATGSGKRLLSEPTSPAEAGPTSPGGDKGGNSQCLQPPDRPGRSLFESSVRALQVEMDQIKKATPQPATDLCLPTAG